MSDRDYREPWYCLLCGQIESALPCRCEMEVKEEKANENLPNEK